MADDPAKEDEAKNGAAPLFGRPSFTDAGREMEALRAKLEKDRAASASASAAAPAPTPPQSAKLDVDLSMERTNPDLHADITDKDQTVFDPLAIHEREPPSPYVMPEPAQVRPPPPVLAHAVAPAANQPWNAAQPRPLPPMVLERPAAPPAFSDSRPAPSAARQEPMLRAETTAPTDRGDHRKKPVLDAPRQPAAAPPRSDLALQVGVIAAIVLIVILSIVIVAGIVSYMSEETDGTHVEE